MKTKITILTFSVAALILAACSSERGDTAATAENTIPYPLETCIVAGEPLGSMGEPVVIIHEGREIKFCCDSCRPKFEADPAKYLPKLDQAGHDD
ncbi:MAG: hypothetical protein ACNA8L_02775 [Luteolibacter sp.]